MEWLNINNIAIFLGLFVLMALTFFIYTALNIKYDKKKTELTNNTSCRQIAWRQTIKNWTDYFWSNSMRFAWITLILLSIIVYGMAIAWKLNIQAGAYISIYFSIVAILFFIFAYISYKNFPAKAKAALEEFESAIKAGIKKETNTAGDEIEKYTCETNNLDKHEYIFDFAVGPKKADFPPFETRPPKKPVIAERKLEFLVLSREFFSICQGATPFNLLNPVKLPPKKKCAPKKAAGPCKEYYYSQVKNVAYEDEKIVIYFNNGDEPVSYPSPKRLGKHGAVINAFRDKLRITERQRLSKIDEHKKFKELKELKNDIEEDEEDEELGNEE